jgi:hypothetical protein
MLRDLFGANTPGWKDTVHEALLRWHWVPDDANVFGSEIDTALPVSGCFCERARGSIWSHIDDNCTKADPIEGFCLFLKRAIISGVPPDCQLVGLASSCVTGHGTPKFTYMWLKFLELGLWCQTVPGRDCQLAESERMKA